MTVPTPLKFLMQPKSTLGVWTFLIGRSKKTWPQSLDLNVCGRVAFDFGYSEFGRMVVAGV
jgi:hypothetical protein